MNSPAAVSDHIQKLSPDISSLVEKVRQSILGVDAEIGEQIKWNSPSFFYTGEMKPFDPKTYKRDIAVMNLRKNEILLVFPTGESVKGVSGILEGNYTDGRRIVRILDASDFEKKLPELQKVIAAWLSTIEK